MLTTYQGVLCYITFKREYSAINPKGPVSASSQTSAWNDEITTMDDNGGDLSIARPFSVELFIWFLMYLLSALQPYDIIDC